MRAAAPTSSSWRRTSGIARSIPRRSCACSTRSISSAVDALLITSQAQVDNLFGVARDHGREPDLHDVPIGAQGPVAEAALERHGLHAAFRPAHGHMGALVLAAAEYLDSISLARSY